MSSLPRHIAFDFGDPKNLHLYIQRQSLLVWVVALVLAFGFLLYFMNRYLDPDYLPGAAGRGRASSILAAVLLMPIWLRAIVFVFLLAFIAEAAYRAWHRMHNGRPAIIIGPSGVARVDPWVPRCFGWHEVREVRRVAMNGTWPARNPSLFFEIVGPPVRRPRWIPPWLWALMPELLTTPRVQIATRGLGYNAEELAVLIRHFAGAVTIHQRTIDT